MKRNHFLQLISVCFVLLWGIPAFATVDSQTAISWVNSKGRELLDTFNEKDIQKKHQKLDDMFLNHVDLDYISQFVIGKYWRQMTEAQKNKYQSLFKRYCLSAYKKFPLDFQNKINFVVNGANCTDDICDVSTSVDIGIMDNSGNPQKFLVSFRIKTKDNTWKIIDLKLAESSLILSYRNRFYEMIKAVDNEIDWFLEDLENSLPQKMN